MIQILILEVYSIIGRENTGSVHYFRKNVEVFTIFGLKTVEVFTIGSENR